MQREKMIAKLQKNNPTMKKTRMMTKELNQRVLIL